MMELIMAIGAMIFWVLGVYHHWAARRANVEAAEHVALSIRCCAAFGEALSLAGYGAHDEAISVLAPFVAMMEEAAARDRH